MPQKKNKITDVPQPCEVLDDELHDWRPTDIKEITIGDTPKLPKSDPSKSDPPKSDPPKEPSDISALLSAFEIRLKQLEDNHINIKNEFDDALVHVRLENNVARDLERQWVNQAILTKLSQARR